MVFGGVRGGQDRLYFSQTHPARAPFSSQSPLNLRCDSSLDCAKLREWAEMRNGGRRMMRKELRNEEEQTNLTAQKAKSAKGQKREGKEHS